MSNTIPYKMLNIMYPDPSQDGGLMIQNNFKTVADTLEVHDANISLLTSGITSVISGSYIDFDATNISNIIPDYSYNKFNILNCASNISIDLPINMSSGNIMTITLINPSAKIVTLNSNYLCSGAKTISTSSNIIFHLTKTTSNYICEYSLIN